MSKKARIIAGSSGQDEPAYLVLGRLRRAHGIKGEIPLEVHTELLDLLVPDSIVYVGDGYRRLIIESTRWKKDLLLIKFNEIDDRTVVSELTNQLLYTKTDQLPPIEDDEIYDHDVIDLRVYEENGQLLGVITQVLKTGANDVYLVEDESGKEVLIPAIEDRIIEIDLDQKKMVVTSVEWYGKGE